MKPLAAFLRSQHEEILREWEAQVRGLPSARDLERPELLDHVPVLLERIADACDRADPDFDLPASRHHGLVRARQGFDVEQVVRELGLLRSTLWRRYGTACGGRIAVEAVVFADKVLDRVAENTLTELVEEHTKAMRQREERLRSILDHAPLPIYVKDVATLRYSRVNLAFCELLGLEPQDIIGRDDRELGAHLQALREDDARAIAAEQGLVSENQIQVAGHTRLFQVVRFVLPTVAGHPEELCAIGTDITERDKTRQLGERFVAILGHDLRNPLSAVTMAASLLLRRGDLAPAQAALVERIERSGKRIAMLVDDLLDLSRMRSGGLVSERHPTHMGAVCQRLVDEIRTAHPGRAIELTCTGDVQGVWDESRVAQAISNLLGNAVQHGEDPIVVRVEGEDEEVVTSVQNGGVPIPAERLARLFEPFLGSTRDGLGLGLSIVQGIVQEHGGTIAVRSTEADGTRFTVRWPRRPRG